MAVERAAGQREQTLLETAKASLPNDAPPEVVEQLAAVTAGVCYDVGDQDALQRALAELGESSQRLYSVGCHYREERGLFQCVELVPTRRSCNTLPQQRHYGLERTA